MDYWIRRQFRSVFCVFENANGVCYVASTSTQNVRQKFKDWFGHIVRKTAPSQTISVVSGCLQNLLFILAANPFVLFHKSKSWYGYYCASSILSINLRPKN